MSSFPSTGILGGSLGLGTDGVLTGGLAAVYVGTVTPAIVPDDGGTQITLQGVFPTDKGMTVTITDNAKISRECYSGVIGQGNTVYSTDGLTLTCWTPPLPPDVDYDVVVTPEGDPDLVAPALLPAYHRTFTTGLFSLRSTAARPRYVGPYSIEDED